MFNKNISFLLAIFFLVALIASTATPALAASGPDVTFLGAAFRNGLVLYFNVAEGFELDAAAKYVVVDGVQYSLSCHTNASGLLACFADVEKGSIGSLASIQFGEFSFETIVPAAKVPDACSGYEYAVYGIDFLDFDTFDFSVGQVGTYTQPCPAAVGDMIPFDEFFADSLPHYYSLNGSDLCLSFLYSDLENGYYFDFPEDCE